MALKTRAAAPSMALLLLTSALLASSACSRMMASFSDQPFEDKTGKRTLGTVVDDRLIKSKIEVNLIKTDKDFKHAKIKVLSHDGVVLLCGQVPSEILREQAEEIAQNVRKVRGVHNMLAVSGKLSWLSRVSDWWLKTKFGMKMRFDNQDLPKIHAVISDSTLYLFGQASVEQGDAIVKVAQKVAGIKKIVRVFEYIEAQPAKPR